MFFIEKFWKNRMRNGIITILLFYPLIETVVFAKIFTTQAVYQPTECFFLRCNTVGYSHLFQVLFLWPLPMYLLILFSGMYWKEKKIGYRNVILSRIGKKQYIRNSLLLSFIGAFGLIMASMFINMIVSYLAFRGGKLSRINTELLIDPFLKWQSLHPGMANIVFSLILAFVSGVIAMAGTMCAITMKDIKVIYGVIMAMWFVLLLKKNSIVLLFQVNSEYSLDTLIPLLIEVIGFYIVIGVIAYYKEMKGES